MITQAIIGAVVVLAALSSITKKGKSPVGMWSIINIFQMLMLLLLTGAYIPKPLRKYLFDRDVVFLNFNFIPFNKLPLVYDFYIWIKFDHYNSDFNEIGVESGSTVVNNISTTAILILFSIIHLVIGLIY